MTYSLENSIGYLVRSVTRALRTKFNKNLQDAGFDITSDHWAVLVTLWNREAQTQKFLGYITMRDKANITRLVDALERRNLVVRIPDEVDRRQNLIHLTPAGREMYQQLLPLVEETLAEAEQNIAEEHLIICKDVLRDIYNNLV